jgi:hypothetical protein
MQMEPPMSTAKLKVQANVLQAGDVVGSGETIVDTSGGLHTPRGKVEVTLEKNGRRRTAVWGAYTMISITRAV